MSKIVVAALYHFFRLDAPAQWQPQLFSRCQDNGIKGTLLLAHEGINGTIAGPKDGIEVVIADLKGRPGLAGLEVKYSHADAMPFLRLKVRLKQEIVTMGQPGTDPTAAVGRYVTPEDWNALIARDDVVVIDTRNDYEVAIGKFEGAIDPETESFRDFPAWWARHHNAFAGKKVAMYCTGGIRCEKSTSFLIGQGVEEVFHLQGGILKYLEEMPEENSLWDGECFVFDQRVSVGHGLKQGPYSLCHACRRPITEEDTRSPLFEKGVTCPSCHGSHTPDQINRFRERQKQVDLAKARGRQHIGQASDLTD